MSTRRSTGGPLRRFRRRLVGPRFARIVNAVLPVSLWRPLYRRWLHLVALQPDSRRALQELLELREDTLVPLDHAAIAFENGVHVKHRLMRYHDFFVDRVARGERVLDVGCGVGAVAYDLAERAGAIVVGVDNNPNNLAYALAHHRHPNLSFREIDVLEELPQERFDVVVLSNVLEHFDDRVGLLRRLAQAVRPERFLIRVPVFARDWTVPLRRELGLSHFSDPTHFTEYDVESLRSELAEAGLDLVEVESVWGELWTTARPGGGGE